jgi:hypothetical protein
MAELMGESFDMDERTQQGLKAFTSLGQMSTKVPVLARPGGAPEFVFIASLEAEKLRVDTSELEGEATLVAKVQRKLRDNDRYSSDDLPDMVITAPAAVVNLKTGEQGLEPQLRHPECRVLPITPFPNGATRRV